MTKEEFRKKVKETGYDSFHDFFKNKTVFKDELISKVYAAAATCNNLLLTGPGGYGKTILPKLLAAFYKQPLITKVGHADLTVEELLGVPDMQLLFEESEYRNAFEKSVFNQEGILVLEEFGDVKPKVTAALKDILTEGGFRCGEKFFRSNISFVIMTSNKEFEDLSIDASTSALFVERFPLKYRLCWDTHQAGDYQNFFAKVIPNYQTHRADLEMLAQFFEMSSDEPISPRRAEIIANTCIDLGMNFINTFDFDSKTIKTFKELQKQKDLKEKEERFIAELVENKFSEDLNVCSHLLASVKEFKFLDSTNKTLAETITKAIAERLIK